VSVYPTPTDEPSVVVVPGEPVITPEGAPCLRLNIILPEADAELWIEQSETQQKGTERTFVSPPLEVGKTYRYDLIARWTENGREKAESRTITGQPGQTVRIDFSKPADNGVAQK
jgi:uncharacterized protein (TIGR03000 family)